MLEVFAHNIGGIGFGVIFRFTHQARGPKTNQLVAAGGGFELHLGVEGVFGFEGVFAIVESGHGALVLTLELLLILICPRMRLPARGAWTMRPT